MAFFSNSKQSDLQLRRKRSTSTTRDRPSGRSTDDKSTEESSFHKHSPTGSAPSTSRRSPDPNDPAPPLPTPVTAGLSGLGFRLRSAGARNGSPFSYDQSSTPIPFTKPTKHASPPPFSTLMIDVPRPRSVEAEQSSSPRAAVYYPDIRPKGNTAPSPSALSPISSSSPVIHAFESPEDPYPGSISPSMPRIERQRPPFSQRKAPVLPLKLPDSPTRTPNSDRESIALPTPVSPPQGRRPAPEPIPICPSSPLGRPHSRSRSATNSPTAYAPGSGPGSARSSARRLPLPIVDLGEASGTRSASASGMSTPSQEAVPSKPREKRQRNVLRKRSITDGTRRRAPESAPASDSEKKTNTHHPRSRSVVFPRRRDSSGPMLDGLQPVPAIPVTVADLTPAKEILVAYKESHRDSFSRDMPLRNSGKMVAIGTEEDSNAKSLISPWSPDLKSGRKDEERAEKRNPVEKSGVGIRSLRRKISGKWSGKEPNRRRNDPTRSVSESAAEVFARTRDTEANRSATFSNDAHPSASPVSGQSPRRERWPEQDGGRVWEEEVGKWAGKSFREAETEEKDVSNSRRLWNLVKRLSSGNLREKASPSSEHAPPVPPLPRDISHKRDMSPSGGHAFHAGEMALPQSAVPESPGGIRRFITAVPSLSIPRSEGVSVPGGKQTSVHYHRSELDSGGSMSPIPVHMNSIHRPGTTGTTPQMARTATTRSSSPSSETTKFFSRSRSSSSSSYGDVIAPPLPCIPPAHAGKHSPSPQYHSIHNDKHENSVTMDRSPSAKTSISLSPRTSDEASPTIPPFEAHHVINKFLPYKSRRFPASPSPCTTSCFPDDEPIILRTEQAKLTDPPPIPKRNPRRPGHHSVSKPSLPAQEHSPSNVIPVQDSDDSEIADGNAFPRPKRRLESGQTSTIPEPRPRSIPDGPVTPEPERHASTAKSTLAFRELTTTQRQLTEQEKNAKWEDLLQRSDKAGGTLHMGSPIMGGLGLWSDRTSVALSVAPSDNFDSAD